MGECCQEQRKAVRTREGGFDRMNVKDIFGTMQPETLMIREVPFYGP